MEETEFTVLLREVRDAVPAVQVAVFVDNEGECIDYASCIDIYDTKVIGAQMLDILRRLESTDEKVGAGAHYALEMGCVPYEMWARRLSEDYVLVLRTEGTFERSHLRSVAAHTAHAFRAAVGIDAPYWEPEAVPIEVSTRPAVGWDYAPDSFREHGERVAVEDVLGRWTDPPDSDGDVCFRIRTVDGRELTLVYDPGADAWAIRVQ